MTIEARVKHVIDDALSLRGRAHRWSAATPLLGSVPELDSLSLHGLLAAIEKEFSFAIDDDDVNSQTFASVGALSQFVQTKTPPAGRA